MEQKRAFAVRGNKKRAKRAFFSEQLGATQKTEAFQIQDGTAGDWQQRTIIEFVRHSASLGT